MKKKNIAITMAGISAVAASAPMAFAAQSATTQSGLEGSMTVNVAEGMELAAQLRKAANVKYQEVKAGETLNGEVFSVEITDGVTTGPVVNIGVLEEAIEDLEKNNLESLTFKVTDKGYNVVDGKVVDYKTSKYNNTSEIVTAIERHNATTGATVLEYKTSVSGQYVEVKRANVKEDYVKIDAKSTKLDFTKAIETKGKLNGFELKYEKADAFVATITVKNTKEVAVADLYDGVRLTQDGTALLNAMEKGTANVAITSGNLLLSQTSGGVTTNSTADTIDPGFNLGQKAYFEMEITTTNATTSNPETVKVTVSDADQFLVRELYDMLVDANALKVKSLIGENRFTTAVEVSKQLFADEAASSVILVGEDAIVDGLAAAPLASQTTGSILLTKQNELPAETEAEMVRLLGNKMAGKTIYLVGGEAKISKGLEAKLKDTGAKIVRLDGKTRFETSLKIAEEMATISTSNTAYVVGGNGEADAMSIAAYAGQTNAPIVVVDKNEVSEDTMEFLEGKNIEIIGGTGVVSAEVEAELKEIDADKKIVRIAGNSRQETNAKVINAKYADADKVYVAKDGYVGGNGKLIDALAVAPLAARDEAPIILTTNDLVLAQQEAVQAKLSNVEEVTQVGGGVIDSAIKMIVKLIKG